MRNPTLVMRETGAVLRKLLCALLLQTNFSACLDAAVSEFGSTIFT